MRLIETIFTKGKLLETDSNQLPKGVLCRVAYPICNIDEKNQNNRVYSRSVWEKVLADESMCRKMKERTLFGQAEHPAETQSDLQLTSHIVTKTWIDDDTNKVMQEMDILNTPCGKIIATLLEAGCQVGVSTRAEGELEEMNEESGKYYNVLVDSYNYVATDFTADPSTFNVKPQKYENDVIENIKEGLKSNKLDKHFATTLLESMNCDSAKAVLESIQTTKDNTTKDEQGDSTISEGSIVKVIEGHYENSTGIVVSIDEGNINMQLDNGTTITIDANKIVADDGKVEIIIPDDVLEADVVLEPSPVIEDESNNTEYDMPAVDDGEINDEAMDDDYDMDGELNDNEQKYESVDFHKKLIKEAEDIDGKSLDILNPITSVGQFFKHMKEGKKDKQYMANFIVSRFVDSSIVERLTSILEANELKVDEAKIINEIRETLAKSYNGNVTIDKNADGDWVFKYKNVVEAKMGVDYVKSVKASIKVATIALKSKDYEAAAVALEDVADDASDAAKAAKKVKKDDDAKEVAAKESEETEKTEETNKTVTEEKVVFASDISRKMQAHKVSDMNEMPPKDSNWYNFAVKYTLTMNKLDIFAKSMGFDNWYDLDLSISPKDLYSRDKDKFNDVLADIRLNESIKETLEYSINYKNANGESLTHEKTIKASDSIEAATMAQELLGDNETITSVSVISSVNEEKSSNYESTSDTLRTLRISEAGMRAEKEKAMEMLEEIEKATKDADNTKIFEIRMLVSKLKKLRVAESVEIDALRNICEEKTKCLQLAMQTLVGLKEKYNTEFAELKASVISQDEKIKNIAIEYATKLSESTISLEEKYKSEFIKHYINFKVTSSGLKIHESSRALLEKKNTVEEVDVIFEEIRDAMRRSALHTDSITEIVIKDDTSVKSALSKSIRDTLDGIGF